LDQIAVDPLRYPKEFEDVREAKVKKYSYCVYYSVEADRIVVISVFHTSRDPSVWQSRA
jgi:toxin ParE1/3/4